MDENTIKTEVRKRYAAVASSGESCCGDSSCCGSSDVSVVRLVDYSPFSVDLPAGADLGLGCGLPTLSAALRPGDTVLDLGSGAGVDVFMAAREIGPQGKAIGVDMTPEMIARARENASKGGYTNVEFRLGEIEALPVEAGSVDVVLSNCVINLVPDKRRAFAEIFRVLKPGGRFSISDIVSFGDLPEAVRQDMVQWAGCIAGALDKEDYLQIIREVGFSDLIEHKLVEYGGTQGAGYGLASLTVEAHKPGGR